MTKRKKQPKLDFADQLTVWLGTKASLLVHTVFFICMFSMPVFGIAIDKMLLVLTTVLSLEAIYLAIFIQIAVNKNTVSLEEVEQDIEEIEQDIGEIGQDIDEIQEDVIEEDVHDKKVQSTLKTIDERLANLQEDLEILRKKGLLK